MEQYKRTAKTLWLGDLRFFIIIERNPIINGMEYAVLHEKDSYNPIHLNYQESKTDAEYIEEAEALCVIRERQLK